MKEKSKLFSFTYIYFLLYSIRRKYWVRENFQSRIFGGFICSGISWTRFDYFWKKSVCLSVVCSLPDACMLLNFEAILHQKLIDRFLQNFILRDILCWFYFDENRSVGDAAVMLQVLIWRDRTKFCINVLIVLYYKINHLE